MLLEFLLGLGQNISFFAWLIGLLFTVISIFTIIAWVNMPSDDKDRGKVLATFRYCFPIAMVLILVGSIPTVDNLWKIRVGLIKFQLAAPENIKAGVETIERIGHKLECQYIGCKEDEKKPEKKE